MTFSDKINQSETMTNINGLEFWSESFGDKKNPPIILIMGSGGQGIPWPEEFCKELAHQGYFVVRYADSSL